LNNVSDGRRNQENVSQTITVDFHMITSVKKSELYNTTTDKQDYNTCNM